MCVQMCVCPDVCVLCLCSVSPSLCSEPIEENPYRPTYIFPDNYDIQTKSKGIDGRDSAGFADLQPSFQILWLSRVAVHNTAAVFERLLPNISDVCPHAREP